MPSIKLLALTLAGTAVAAAGLQPALGADRPPTSDEMWKIIQRQQQQIDKLTSMLEAKEKAQAVPEVKKLERKTDVLSEEVEKLRTKLVLPEKKEYKSAYGFGPAASKVYQQDQGLSIGGYGEASYQAVVADRASDPSRQDKADLERLVIYAGYKFSDSILFNSEIEFEHATTGEGSEEKGEVSVEFASLDFFINPYANVRGGLILMPVGFINQIHEPPFFFGNNRPVVEQRIIPSTWSELGVGLFGQFAPGLTYTTYAVSGLNAQEFGANGIREGRQSGSNAKANDLGFVGRLDYSPIPLPGLTVGGAAYVGNAGQNQEFLDQRPNVTTQLYEAHVQWKYRGLEFRTLGSWGFVGDAALLSAAKGETIGSDNYGWYTELGYDLVPWLFPNSTQYLAPFFRYEKYDTIARAPRGFLDDKTKDQRIYQFGLQYKPIPNVVIKADYRNFTSAGGDLPDDFNLGLGFIF